MRILFSFVGGRGHLEPLVPFARAAAAAGHSVAFGSAPAIDSSVRAAGFESLPLGTGGDGRPERIPLRPLDSAREERDLRERFVRGAAYRRAPLAIALCSDWRPDLLVCDETDFGVVVAAKHLGVPHATFSSSQPEASCAPTWWEQRSSSCVPGTAFPPIPSSRC